MNCISCTIWTDRSSSQGISLSTRIDSSCTDEAHSLLVQLLLCIVIFISSTNCCRPPPFCLSLVCYTSPLQGSDLMCIYAWSVHIHGHAYACTHTHTHTHAHTHAYTHAHTTHTYTHTCTYIHIYVAICTSTRLHTCMCIMCLFFSLHSGATPLC